MKRAASDGPSGAISAVWEPGVGRPVVAKSEGSGISSVHDKVPLMSVRTRLALRGTAISAKLTGQAKRFRGSSTAPFVRSVCTGFKVCIVFVPVFG